MAKVNLRDRASVERAYPAERFARDTARNELPGAIRRGLRILSAPGADGGFELEPGTRHTGEAPGTVFLAADRSGEDPGYRRFIDDVIAAARDLQETREREPAADDRKLRGLRQ